MVEEEAGLILLLCNKQVGGWADVSIKIPCDLMDQKRKRENDYQ